MRFIHQLFDFYIQSSLHVAVAITSLVYVTGFSNQFCNQVVYPCCVFFGTIVAYNFLKYIELIAVKRICNRKTMALVGVTVFSFIAFLFFFFELKRSLQIQLLATGSLVLMYPFLRKRGGLKLFLVSFVITIVTVYLPVFSQKQIEGEDYLTLIQRFLFVTSLMIPFEIYDSQFDKRTLNTIPQQFGIRNAKLLGMVLIVPFWVLEFLKCTTSLTVLPVGLVTVMAIQFTTLQRHKFYTSFWVESIPIFWLAIILVFK